MSMTPTPMGVMLLLQQHGLVGHIRAACDFGSMEFDARLKEQNTTYERFFEGQGRTVPPSFYDAETGRLYGIAGDMYRALGWDYASFDIDGRWGSVSIDLNVEQVPDEYRNRFDLSLNIGTSEHVFNQANFFKQFHDVTRVGGLMFHVVPFNSFETHGLYQYCPSFFLSLAKYNKYDVLGFWQTGKPQTSVFRPGLDKPFGTRTTATVVLRRTTDDDFRMPLQLNEPMVISAAAEARYGAFERHDLQSLRPGGTLPQAFHLNPVDGTLTPGIPPLTEKDEFRLEKTLRHALSKEKPAKVAKKPKPPKEPKAAKAPMEPKAPQ